MAFFKVTYLSQGEKKEHFLEADNLLEAHSNFKALNLGVYIKGEVSNEPFSLKVKKAGDKIKHLLEKSGIDQVEYASALHQFHVMLDAGLPLVQTVDNIAKNLKSKRLQKIFSDLSRDVQSGRNLSDSLEKYEKEVGNISISMIRVGEQTGTLAESIEDLANILDEILDNRKRLKKATMYPLIIIFFMIVAFVVVILMVIPTFKSMFSELGASLPLSTQFLLWIEEAVRTFGVFILIAAVMLSTTLSYLHRNNYKARYKIDKSMLRIYIVGKVLYWALVGRFMFVFDKLIAAGIPIIDSLDTALNIVDNAYLRNELQNIKLAIEDGRGLSEGFRASNQFEDMIIQMVASGEESGALNRMIDKAATYYRTKYRDLVDNIATLIEPLLITAIAGFVVTLALGIFLPMWDVVDAVGLSG